ncbi:sulfotransferase [soil metagenome]
MEFPIFLVGTPRSGTSLISQIIGSHPGIAVPFESYFYAHFASWLQLYGDLGIRRNRERLVRDILQTNVLQQWVPRVDAQDALEHIDSGGRYDFGGVIAGIMASWCSGQGKRRWGEKTPAHLFCADRILEDFPHAQFVHILRDGRDVAVSWKKVAFGPKHVYAAARRWVEVLEATAALQERLGPAQFFELRYEDLLRDPEQTVGAVCDFLGEEYTPDMLAFYRSRHGYPTDARNDANLARPIMAGNAEKWRQTLSSRELEIFEAVAGEELKLHGYELACEHPRVSAAQRRFYRYVEHPLRKIAPMARNLSSQRELAIRCLLYLRLRLGG